MRNVERVQRTRSALLSAGRTLFARHGFAETATEAILAEAGVTRGALYHHFTDKAALFEAVCDGLSGEAAAAVESAVAGIADAAEALEVGLVAWVRFVRQPEVRRILLLEAPTVLGWERWTALDQRHAFQSLKAGVSEALESGALRFSGSAEVLATMINGATNALALRDEIDRVDVEMALTRLVAAFLSEPPLPAE